MKIVSHTTKNPKKREHLRRGVGEIAPDATLQFIESDEEVRNALSDAEIFYTYNFERDWWREDNRLKWVHIGGSGVNQIRFPELLESGIVITNSRGVHGRNMAEYVLAAMLRFSQKFDLAEKYRIHRNWRIAKMPMTQTSFTLAGKNAGIIGAGEVGSAVGELCKNFGMNIYGLTRSVKEKPSWADEWGTSENRPDLLKWSDFVVICAPGIPETVGMIGAGELDIMNSSSYIINISRGNIIDEKALIDALQNEKIAGACLDVFTKEPLPENSTLFNVRNLFITPHISGNYPGYSVDVIDMFLKNLKLYIEGGRLINMVDLRRGY